MHRRALRRRGGRLITVGAVTLCLLVALLGARSAEAPLPSNTIIDLNRTEPAVAVDPLNPLRLLAASNSNYAPNPLQRYPPAYFSSSDGGWHWQGNALPMPAPFWTGADTTVAFDQRGAGYIGMVGEDPAAYCKQSARAAAILVARSPSGGRVVGLPTVVDINPPGENDDKPSMTVWNAPASADAVVYVVWTRWLDAGGSKIMFSRSLDGGRTYAPARALYSSAGSNMGAQPAVGPHGELYVAWAHWTSAATYTPMPLRILVKRSLDQGRTFGDAVPLAASWGLPLMLSPGLVRVFSMPSIGVDGRAGTVYVVWPRARVSRPVASAPLQADIVLSHSRDRGATWSAPVALNDSAVGDRFMPTLTTLAGGRVVVAFYDRRADRRGFDVYLASVQDVGSTLLRYPNRRLTRRLSSIDDVYYIAPGSTCLAPGRFIGDYITLADDPAGGTLCVVWADTQRRARDQTDLRYSRVPISSAYAGTPRP